MSDTIVTFLCLWLAVEYEAVWPSDVHRFQYSLQQLDSVREVAQQQRAWMEHQPNNFETWQRLKDSQEYRLQAWSWLHSIKQYTVESPWPLESWLRELRELIGRDNYYRGLLPDPRIMLHY